MKSILFILVFLLGVGSSSSYGFEAYCPYINTPHAGVNEDNSSSQFGFASKMRTKCYTQGKTFSVTLTNVGPVIEVVQMQPMWLNCPLVTQNRVKKVVRRKGAWNVYGVAASAGFGLDARAAIAANHRGAFCTLIGIGGIGIGGSAGVINITVNNVADY